MKFSFKIFSNLKPQTSNLKPQTSNLKPQTSNLKLKRLVLPFLLLLLFYNCEKEVIVETPIEKEQAVKNTQEDPYKIENVSINQIPQIKNFLNRNPIVTKSITDKGTTSKNDETAFGTVDFSRIKKLTDTLGQVTYTFRMIAPVNQTDDINGYYFDNLVIKVLDDLGNYEAYILRYTYGGSYKAIDYSYQGVSGKIEHYPLTETSFGLDFLDTSLTTRQSCVLKMKSQCNKPGKHPTLQTYGCTGDYLIVTFYVECLELFDEIVGLDNYTVAGNTGSGPGGFGGSGPNLGGTGSVVISPYDEEDYKKFDAIISPQLLDPTLPEKDYLFHNYTISMDIYDFFEVDASSEAVILGNNIVDSGIDKTLVTPFPFVKYPEGSNYVNDYPELTILLKEYIPYLKNNLKLINTISELTGLINSEIAKDLTWGFGPEVHIEQLGVVDGEEIKGKFNPSEPNKIILDIDLIIALEALASIENPTTEQIEQLQLFDGLITFAVCLHEYVHFADFAFDGSMQDNEDLELGLLFEELFVNGYYEIAPDGKVVLIPKK